MQFDLPRALGALIALVAAGIAGLAAAGVMATSTVLMMVLPSTLLFGLIAFGLGVKHGEYRAAH
jgi:hypothetical protein